MDIAFDSTRSEIVLFIKDQTWTWNGTSWIHENPQDFPQARNRMKMEYDSFTDKVILFGGTELYVNQVLGDTWLWDGTNWEIVEGPCLCRYAPEDQPLIFVRGKGAPFIETVEWDSCGGLGTLTVSNGGLENSYYERVSSSEIYLNGELVVGPQNFNQNVETITVSIELFEGYNVLEVELRGKPGGAIQIEFMPVQH